MIKRAVLVCRTYILAEDLEHFLEPEKAQQAFDILDVDGDGQVTLHNIRDAVVSIYQVTLSAAKGLAAQRTFYLGEVLGSLGLPYSCRSWFF